MQVAYLYNLFIYRLTSRGIGELLLSYVQYVLEHVIGNRCKVEGETKIMAEIGSMEIYFCIKTSRGIGIWYIVIKMPIIDSKSNQLLCFWGIERGDNYQRYNNETIMWIKFNS